MLSPSQIVKRPTSFFCQKTRMVSYVYLKKKINRHYVHQQIFLLLNVSIYRRGEWRGLVVIAEDCHSKGRRIESQSFFNFFVHPIGRGGLAKKKRKSTKVSRNEEMRERGSGERMKKDRQANQDWKRERLSVRFDKDD